MTNQELVKWYDAIGQAKSELKESCDFEGEAFMVEWLKCPTPKAVRFSMVMKCVQFFPGLREKHYVLSWMGKSYDLNSTEEVVPLVESLGFTVTNK